LLSERQAGASPSGRGRNYTPPKGGVLRSAESPLQGADDFRRFSIRSNHHRGSYTSPALAAASYPLVDLPPESTLHRKLLSAAKFTKSSYTYPTE